MERMHISEAELVSGAVKCMYVSTCILIFCLSLVNQNATLPSDICFKD
jgi:hypothetical protein